MAVYGGDGEWGKGIRWGREDVRRGWERGRGSGRGRGAGGEGAVALNEIDHRIENEH